MTTSLIAGSESELHSRSSVDTDVAVASVSPYFRRVMAWREAWRNGQSGTIPLPSRSVEPHSQTSSLLQALAWCPWQTNLLATGGGSSDQTIHFWSSTTGARTASLPTNSQVTSLVWSPHSKELVSTHGFPDNNICLWSYPSLQKIYDVPAHDARVLCSALSPDGCTVATGAGDENLKFWKIWEAKAVGKKGEEVERDGHGRSKSAVRIR